MGDLGSIHLFRRHRPELRDISAAVLLSAAPGGPQDLDDGVAAAPDAADDAAIVIPPACNAQIWASRCAITSGASSRARRGRRRCVRAGARPRHRRPAFASGSWWSDKAPASAANRRYIFLQRTLNAATRHHGSGLATVGSAMGGAAS